MVKFTVVYTPDGKVKCELDFLGLNYDYTMIPDDHGKTSNKNAIEYQVEDLYHESLDEETYDMLSMLSYSSDESEIEEALEYLKWVEDDIMLGL